MMHLFKKIIQSFILICVLTTTAQGEFITVGKDSIQIYVEDKGSGKPIIFIPGWTMSSQFFLNQKTHFKKDYRYISYDPRSHGASTKTELGNTYKYHATDLKDLISQLNLEDVILVGWSSGCATIYEYVKYYGTDKLSHLIFIDEPPKWVGNVSEEWVYGTFEGYRESLRGLITNRYNYAKGTVEWMLRKPQSDEQQSWMIREMLKTPNYAALSLYVDGLINDYTDILKTLDNKLPMLFLVRASWYEETSKWLKKHASNSEVEPIESHAMFWESPEVFNKLLETFLRKRS